MSKLPKVLVVNKLVPKIGFDVLKEKCTIFVCDEFPEPNSQQIIAKLNEIKDVDAIFWSSKYQLNNDILDAAGPNLKLIATMSAGVDNLNIVDIKSRGVKITNTPNVLNTAVAEMAVLLALSAGRRIHEGRLQITEEKWIFHPQWLLGQELEGSTVGLVGFGRIGQTIAKRLKGFEVGQILYTCRNPKSEGDSLGAKFVSMDVLLEESDFVIVVCPLTPDTNKMFNDDLFKKMKNTSVFVNVGRGGIVDQDALIRALKNGTIFAAGLDVMVPEPLPKDHELLSLANCVVVPHMGSCTMKTRNAMAELTAKNILAFFNGQPLLTPV